MASTALFELPIEPQGSIVCTQPQAKVYLLTFTSPPDNRLTPSFNAALLLALDIIEQQYPKGVVVTTSGIAKFYSNGLDLAKVTADPRFFHDSMYPLWRRLLSYPMPTVALINGHCFAGGLITAMMHDYRVMNPNKGFACMNEVDFGAPLRSPMTSIFRQKLPRADVYRAVVLEGRRFGAQDALRDGLVDTLGGLPEALSYAAERNLATRGDSGVYGVLKAEMWRETLGYLERDAKADNDEWNASQDRAEVQRRAGAARVKAFAQAKPKI